MKQTEIESKILQMCAGKPMYSLEIRDRLNQGKPFWQRVSLGAIYIALDALERDGFVQSWYEEQQRPERGGARRRLYMATGKRKRDRADATARDDNGLLGQGGVA